MAEILISLNKYLEERVTLLLKMEAGEERDIRLNEINKFLTIFFVQLQKAKERGETW